MAAKKQDGLENFLSGGGEMGALIRATDWSKSSLGKPAKWPQSLKTTLSIILNSKFPMFLWWGPDLLCFYNDAYRPSLGENGKHPGILGQKAETAWHEIWDIIKPLIDSVMAGGDATWSEDQLIPIYRNGKLDDVYWTFSYSPVSDESSAVAGVFVTCTETTSKVLLQKKTEESERNYRNLVTVAPISTAVFTGKDFVIALANDEALNLWGKDKSVIGKTLREALPEMAGQPFIDMLDSVYQTGINYEGKENVAYLTKNGIAVKVYVNFIFSPLRNGSGEVYAILAIGYDVTEQVEVRDQLKEAEERARMAIDAAMIGVFDLSLPDRNLVCSQRFCDIWGLDPASAKYEDVIRAIHPDDMHIREEANSRISETGRIDYEVRILWPDGSTHWVNVQGKLFYDENKVPSRMLGSVLDINEQKTALKRIEDLEEHSRLAIESGDLGTFGINHITGEFSCSARTSEIFGYGGRPVTHQDLKNAIHPDDALIRERAHELSFSTGLLQYEVRVIWPDRSIHWINVRGKLYYDHKGTPMRVLGIVTDITAQKQYANTIEEKEAKFRNTVMQAPVGITMLRGADFYVEMANEKYLELVDREKYTFVGRPIFDSLQEVKDVVKPLLDGVLQTGVSFYGNEVLIPIKRHGKTDMGHFNFIYQALRGIDGSITGVIVVVTEVTEQVEAKKALEESERRFRSIVTQSPVPMTILRGREMVIEIANEVMLKNMWRRSAEEVMGQKLMDIFPELKGQKYPEILAEIFENRQTYKETEAEALVDGPDGMRRFYLDFEYAPLFGIDGSVSGIMATTTDVTEKVEARKLIEESQKRYFDLIHTLPVGLFTVDKDGYIDIYNEAAVALWGRSPVRGHDRWDGAFALYTLDMVYIPFDQSPIATAIKEDRALEMEIYIMRTDGQRRHVIVHPKPIHDSDGKVTGAMKTMIDLTESKEAELALRTSEQKFSLLSQMMPQQLWTADAKGTLNYFSQSVYNNSGLSVAELEQKGWLHIVHPDDWEENIKQWMHSVQTGEDFHFEHRFRRYDGAYRWHLSRALPQRDSDGQILMWVGTSTDIHQQKTFAQDMESQVLERTKDLRAANSELEKTNQELASFAYVSSHDLQEPLRKIQTFASLILEKEKGALSPTGQDYFLRIQRSARRMQILIEDLLSYSRITTREKVFQKTDLNILLQEVQNELDQVIREKGAAIHASPLPTLNIIPFQFTQLFTNIISNSLKFAKKGVPLQITVQADISKGINKEEPDQNYWRISISDNGIGFDPLYGQRIFEVFQRLHGKNEYDGTGIGLAICKKIVENHKGYITATGKPNAGATFDIYIPIGDVPGQ